MCWSGGGSTRQYTGTHRNLAEDEIAELNATICAPKQHVIEYPRVTIRYFLQGARKSGGSYAEVDGEINRINGPEVYSFFVRQGNLHR